MGVGVGVCGCGGNLFLRALLAAPQVAPNGDQFKPRPPPGAGRGRAGFPGAALRPPAETGAQVWG